MGDRTTWLEEELEVVVSGLTGWLTSQREPEIWRPANKLLVLPRCFAFSQYLFLPIMSVAGIRVL